MRRAWVTRRRGAPFVFHCVPCDDGITSSDMDSYLEIPTYREYVQYYFLLRVQILCKGNSCAEILLPYLTLPVVTSIRKIYWLLLWGGYSESLDNK